MLKQKVNKKSDSYFLGSYILSLKDYPQEGKGYVSITLCSYNDNKRENVEVIVYYLAGYPNNRYPNPSIPIVKECWEKNLPIACVYYDNEGRVNIMQACYSNFSVKSEEEYPF